MHWLHLDVQLFLDPFATLSTRRNKTIASNKATVLNHLTAMTRGIAKMRQLAVTDIDLLDLVNVINNYHVLPSRGDRKRKGPSKEGYKIKRSDPRAADLVNRSVSVRRKS
jgi:hypothetical protein